MELIWYISYNLNFLASSGGRAGEWIKIGQVLSGSSKTLHEG
jgi:hypothetical protein